MIHDVLVHQSLQVTRRERWSAAQLAAHRNIDAHRRRQQPLAQPSLQLQTAARKLGDVTAVSLAAQHDLTLFTASMNSATTTAYDHSSVSVQDEDAKVYETTIM
jgi:hypothetical protein